MRWYLFGPFKSTRTVQGLQEHPSAVLPPVRTPMLLCKPRRFKFTKNNLINYYFS